MIRDTKEINHSEPVVRSNYEFFPEFRISDQKFMQKTQLAE